MAAPSLVVPAANGNGVGSVAIDHDQLLWLAPSVLWEDGSIGPEAPAIEQPRFLELTSDEFTDDFLAFMTGDDPNGEGPAGIGNHGPSDGAGTMDDPLVLYQPLHQRYYFVLGSLVCRRVGLPDRTVDPRTERVSFVVRRLVTRLDPSGDGEVEVEQAWFPKSSMWIDVTDPTELATGEEQLPMNGAPVEAPVSTGAAANMLGLDEPGRRQLQYGYVPVAGRTNKPAVLSDSAALAALTAADSGAGAGDDARLMAFRLRVQLAWKDMAERKELVYATTADGSADEIAKIARLHLDRPSLDILLELYDWLDTYLPSVRQALLANTALPAGARETLRQRLNFDIIANGAAKPLRTALAEVQPYLALLRGDDSGGTPSISYDVSHAPGRAAPLDSFASLISRLDDIGGTSRSNGGRVHAALVEEDADANGTGAPAQVPPELSGFIVARPADAAQLDDRHVLRLVYEHEPCAPLLSKPSAVVRFAGIYDKDAPARKVRIQVPDPINMRRFNRGVAIEMPPNLRKILDGVTPKLLKEEPLGEGSDWGIGMICSFSFQIFMILGFIIAFIFLILLNIAFWWLAFIKICFPIPMKKSQGGP